MVFIMVGQYDSMRWQNTELLLVPYPRMHFNKFPFEPLPRFWPSAPCVASMGILLTEINSHHLTLFIPSTALSLGLPLFQSPSFPQSPSLAFHLCILLFFLPTFPLPPPLPSLCLAFNSNFRHNEVVLADSLASRISVVWACCVAL